MAWLYIVTQWIDRDRGEMVSWHDCILLHSELTETEVRGFHGMTVHCCTVNWLRWKWGSPKIPVVTQWVDIRRWDGFMAWFIDCTCSHSEWTQTVSVQVAQWKWILKGLMQMLMLGVEAAQWKWGDGWWRCWCWVLKQHSGSEERVDADVGCWSSTVEVRRGLMLMLGVEAAQWKWGEGWCRCWCCRWKKVGGRGHWTARLESSRPTLWRWFKRAMGSSQVGALLVIGFLSLLLQFVLCVVVVDSILLSVCACLSLFNICHSYFLHNLLL